MSIQRLNRDHINVFTILAHPSQSYSSASFSDPDLDITQGIEGAVHLMPTRVKSIKAEKKSFENMTVFTEGDDAWSTVSMANLNLRLTEAQAIIDGGGTDILYELAPVLDGELSTLRLMEQGADGTESERENAARQNYMTRANIAATSTHLTKSFAINRLQQTDFFHYDYDLAKFGYVKDVLSRKYRAEYTNTNFTTTNYQSLNFFTASTMASSNVLIYNNMRGWADRPRGRGRGVRGATYSTPEGSPYTPYTSFTYQFWINPRYTTDGGIGLDLAPFNAGTLLHISSTVAISLVTGSELDGHGKPSAFRMMLQLSHSAEIAPSRIEVRDGSTRGSSSGLTTTPAAGEVWPPGAFDYPNDLIFLSPDNSLKRNHWHHVAVRWGTDSVNSGTGSFVIDGKLASEFCINSGSVTQIAFQDQIDDGGRYEPAALFIGNFIEGTNKRQVTPTDVDGTDVRGQNIATFFNSASKETENYDHQPWYGITSAQHRSRYGVYGSTSTHGGATPSGQQTNNPDFTFQHALNAEVHDIRIYETYQTVDDINITMKSGPSDYTDMLFYLPVFFVKEAPMRRFMRVMGSDAGLANTCMGVANMKPFNGDLSYAAVPDDDTEAWILLYTASDGPINIQFAKQMNAQQISVENYTREFVQGAYPRLYHLTESAMGAAAGGEQLYYENTIADMNRYVFSVKTNNSRNFLIMPNDNGLFQPNFDLLASGTTVAETSQLIATQHTSSVQGRSDRPYARFVDDNNVVDLTVVSLRNLMDVSDIDGKEPFQVLNPSDGMYTETGDFSSKIDSSYHMNGFFSWADPVNGDGSSRFKASGRPFGQFASTPTSTGFMGLSSSFNIGIESFGEEMGILSNFRPIPGLKPTGNPSHTFLRNDLGYGDSDSESYSPGNGEDYRQVQVSGLPVYLASGDRDSNLTTLFDMSDLYYGDRILPETFVLTDNSFTGSDGKVKITLRDDGRGGLYRADSETPHAKWNNIGNLYYNDGIAFIKSPHIYRIGSTNFKISMLGENEVHAMSIDVPCLAGQIDLSNNPTFKPLKPSNDINETAEEFVYISGIDLLDDNLNVVARATLAQPIVKRISDEFLFKIKVDF